MKLKNALVAVAAMGMVVSPVAAQATTAKAAKVSASVERKSAPVRAKHKAGPGSLLIALLALGAVGLGVAVAADGDSDEPASN